MKEIGSSKDLAKMKQVKKEVYDGTLQIVEIEELVAKLQREVIEWNPLRKLIKRDEELEKVETEVKDMQNTMTLDRKLM